MHHAMIHLRQRFREAILAKRELHKQSWYIEVQFSFLYKVLKVICSEKNPQSLRDMYLICQRNYIACNRYFILYLVMQNYQLDLVDDLIFLEKTEI